MKHEHFGRARRREPGRYGSRKPRSRPSSQTFLREVLIGSAIVAFIAWSAQPQLKSLWDISTESPETIAQVERSVYYRNCDAARAAGAAPIYRGSPGYREQMDGDSDGVACEPYRYR